MGRAVLQLKNGIAVSVSENGSWVVTSDAREYPLELVGDFFRAWQLLDHHFPEVAPRLHEIAELSQSCPFAFEKLIASALLSNNSNMIDCAMEWVLFINEEQRGFLIDLFIALTNSQVGSQRSRQIARKYIPRSIRQRR